MIVFLLLCLSGSNPDPLAPLQALEGSWRLTFYQIDENGAWNQVGSSESQIVLKLGGKVVQEETTILTAASRFPLVVLYSYDPVRKVYRKASTDGVTGLMDIQEGQMQGQVLTLTNVKSQTWFVGSSGKELGFKIQLDFSDPTRPLMTADLSTDHGETWFAFQKVQYERISGESGTSSNNN